MVAVQDNDRLLDELFYIGETESDSSTASSLTRMAFYPITLSHPDPIPSHCPMGQQFEALSHPNPIPNFLIPSHPIPSHCPNCHPCSLISPDVSPHEKKRLMHSGSVPSPSSNIPLSLHYIVFYINKSLLHVCLCIFVCIPVCVLGGYVCVCGWLCLAINADMFTTRCG
ncbi:unnamed protein product [Absidia cylindrospora]